MSTSATSAIASSPSAATALADASAVAQTRANGTPSREEVRKVAQQFEAIIIRQLLTPAIEPVMNGSLGGAAGGGGGGVYGYMLTDALATNLSQGSGMGLAPLLEKQLSPRAASDVVTSSQALKLQTSSS